MEKNWLIPFKGRHDSGTYEQNFLWHCGSIYIMDNHRAALWCWLQHIKEGSAYHLFHMDRHYDALGSHIEEWKAHLPDLRKVGIQDYLNLSYSPDNSQVPIIRSDNYLSLFLECYGSLTNCIRFATHDQGDKPIIEEKRNCMHVPMWKVPENLQYWLSSDATSDENQWIFNLDLDYFFCDYARSQMLMSSDDYIVAVFEAIAQKYREERIAVLTVSLSPEYCGSWQQAEEVCSRFCNIMGLDFNLPE